MNHWQTEYVHMNELYNKELKLRLVAEQEIDELKKKLELATEALHRITHDFECVPQSVASEALNKLGGKNE